MLDRFFKRRSEETKINLTFIQDPVTGLPLLTSVYPIVGKQLSRKNQIGFLYFDIVNYRQLEEAYGKTDCQEFLRRLGDVFKASREKFFRQEDLVCVSGPGSDSFIVFLFSPPRHKERFNVSDLKLVAYRIAKKLEEVGVQWGKELSIKEKITFHSGHTFILLDPNLPVERLIYEAQREAALKSRLEQVMAQFVSNISHELRTPITCIKGYVETLLEGAMSEPDTAKRFLGIIHEETERLDRLIRDLLDLSMMESSRTHMNRLRTDLGQLTKDAVNFLRDYAEKKQITLTDQVAENLPQVQGDEDRLEQVLINIIDNAIKYTPDGGKVLVSCVEDDGFVKVSVADTGPGILPEDLERVFERFYRVDSDRSTKTGGRGLGLAIAKHIVEAHAGALWAESQAGEGSTFYFTIPVEELVES